MKRRGFKGEIQISNYLKFYVTKPLLRYDYAIVKRAIDRENNPTEYSEDFEGASDSFYDEKLEKGESEANQENAKPFTSPEKGFPNFPNGIVISGDKKSNTALKKIMDDSNFSASYDEEAQERSMEREKEVYVAKSAGKSQNKIPTLNSANTIGQIGVSDFNRQDQEDDQEEKEEEEEVEEEEEEEPSIEERKDTINSQKPPQYQEKENRQYMGSNQNVSKESQKGDRSYERESYLERREQENNSRIAQERRFSSEERTILKNRIGVLEDKYAMLVDTMGHYRNDRQFDELKPDMTQKSTLDEAIFGEPSRTRERKKVKKEDDEFYQLHQEIMKDRELALQAEIDYVMHKRTNFPAGFY